MEENKKEFTATTQVNETPVQTEPKTKFCKYCGTQIDAASAFCSACGKPQENVPVEQSQQFVQQPVQQPQQPQMAAVFQQPAVATNTQNTTSTTIVVEGGRSNGLGTAGFVLALLAFLVCWVPVLDFIVWFLGALFSFIGVFKRPRGLAIAGLIISFIGIIVLITFFGTLLSFMK